MRFTVTIGWTTNDAATRARGYLSYEDGYRPGAAQHTETVTVEWTNHPRATTESISDWERFRDAGYAIDGLEPRTATADRIATVLAESVFYALNAPSLTPPHLTEGLLGQVRAAIDATGYRGRQAGHYSLSVGDTVTVAWDPTDAADAGLPPGPITVACARAGWDHVRWTTTTPRLSVVAP